MAALALGQRALAKTHGLGKIDTQLETRVVVSVRGARVFGQRDIGPGLLQIGGEDFSGVTVGMESRVVTTSSYLLFFVRRGWFVW